MWSMIRAISPRRNSSSHLGQDNRHCPMPFVRQGMVKTRVSLLSLSMGAQDELRPPSELKPSICRIMSYYSHFFPDGNSKAWRLFDGLIVRGCIAITDIIILQCARMIETLFPIKQGTIGIAVLSQTTKATTPVHEPKQDNWTCVPAHSNALDQNPTNTLQPSYTYPPPQKNSLSTRKTRRNSSFGPPV